MGGQGEYYTKGHHWEIGVAYRRLTADKWFVGSELREDLAPFGQPLYININSLDLTVTYGVTSRLGLALTLPFSYGTHSRFYGDSTRHHKVSGAGLGDINLVGNFWLWDPAKHATGNLAVGLGVKTPTGNNKVEDDFFTDSGVTRYLVDQAIQLGDGGWGIILQTQAFRQVADRLFAYLSGSYLLSPKEMTDAQQVTRSGTPNGVFLSVPDVYSARMGAAYALAPERGLSISLGGRIDGIPVRDLIGGGDDGFRRPGYTLYLDSGLSFTRGESTLTLSVPIRVHQNFKSSLRDRAATPPRRTAGDLADYLIFAGYTYRF